MANADTPFGLAAQRHLTGGAVRFNAYFAGIGTGYARNIFYGDPVVLNSDATVFPAAAGDTLIGVFAGVQWIAADGEPKWSKYWPASTTLASNTEAIAYVFDDPNLVFEVQCNTNFTLTDIGTNCDIFYASGTTSNGISRVEAESDFAASTRQLRVVGFVRDGENETGTNAKIEVIINEHRLRVTTGV